MTEVLTGTSIPQGRSSYLVITVLSCLIFVVMSPDDRRVSVDWSRHAYQAAWQSLLGQWRLLQVMGWPTERIRWGPQEPTGNHLPCVYYVIVCELKLKLKLKRDLYSAIKTKILKMKCDSQETEELAVLQLRYTDNGKQRSLEFWAESWQSVSIDDTAGWFVPDARDISAWLSYAFCGCWVFCMFLSNTPFTQWSWLDELAVRALVEPASWLYERLSSQRAGSTSACRASSSSADERSTSSFVNVCNITPFKWPDSQLIKPARRASFIV